MYGFFAFLFVIVLRLFYLQVDQWSNYAQMGEKNFLRTEIICPPRGNFIDSNGVILASNKPVFDLYWEGSGIKNLSLTQLEFIKKVDQILESNFYQDEDKLKSISFAEKYTRRLLLKSDLSFDQLCKISEQCSNCSNLVIINRFRRVYPYNNLASHILGYLARQDQCQTVGLTGLEKVFEQDLKGEKGYILNMINSRGIKLDKKYYKDAKAGKDLILNLDLNLQKIAESIYPEGESGAFVIMDPEDGAIKVFLSYPNFDPNIFLNGISQQDWQEKLAYNNPLINRVTSAVYPPASTFKIVTLTAGIEEGVITTESNFNCHGYEFFCGRKYHCVKHSGHGNLTAKQALAYSCNIPCFKIAQKIKINQVADYAFRFGLGKKTGFLLPEKEGLIPTYEWKQNVKKEKWWKGETLSTCIGQTYTLVTPLQIARMIASISSGYLVRPRILKEEDVVKDDLKISRKTLTFLKNAMHEATIYGSARLLGYLSDFEVYAKTGTAQTSSLTREKISKKQYEHAWIACNFSYKRQKPLTMLILIENMGSSTPAIQLAYKFLKEYKDFYEKSKGGIF